MNTEQCNGEIPVELRKSPEETFRGQISGLVNSFLREHISNTPDYILANYMADCLQSFEKATNARDKWFGTEHWKDLEKPLNTSIKEK